MPGLPQPVSISALNPSPRRRLARSDRSGRVCDVAACRWAYSGVFPYRRRSACAAIWPRRDRCGGLGLAEVLICLAMIALLAAYGMPGYRTQIMRAYRVDAVTALYRAAHYIEQRQLDGAPDGPAVLPAGLAQAPASGQAVYRLTVAAADADNGGYAIEADPLENGPMRADSACGGFILDATGQRANRFEGGVSSKRVDACWEGRRQLF